MLKRLLVLLPALVLLGTALTCDYCDNWTVVTLKNSCLDPFHPDGGGRLDIGSSKRFYVDHEDFTSITIERPKGTVRATISLDSQYDSDDPKQWATVTVYENPYFSFSATSDDPMIRVTVYGP
jgi:hypothetical protein